MPKFKVSVTDRDLRRDDRSTSCEPVPEPSAMTACDGGAAGCEGIEAGPEHLPAVLEPLLPLDD